MTKDELRKHLEKGDAIVELFSLILGQGCEIVKDTFVLGDDIIYIPDLHIYDFSFYESVKSPEDIENIVAHSYTSNDFVAVAEGDQALAYRLFCYVDWQSPDAALPEVEYEDDEDAIQANVAYKQHLGRLAAEGIDISDYYLSVRLD